MKYEPRTDLHRQNSSAAIMKVARACRAGIFASIFRKVQINLIQEVKEKYPRNKCRKKCLASHKKNGTEFTRHPEPGRAQRGIEEH